MRRHGGGQRSASPLEVLFAAGLWRRGGEAVLTAPCLFGGRYDRLTAVLDQGGLRYLDAGAGLFLWIDLRRARTPHCTAHRTAPPDPPSGVK